MLSCTQNQQEERSVAQYIVDINNPVAVSIDDFIIDIDTIRLETTNESLMREINVIHIMNDNFYILTNDGAYIYIFDSKGKYLAKINDRGNGPNEYVRITGFEIDPVNERIIISDNFSRKLLIYDKEGKLINVIRIDFDPLIIASHKDGFINFYSGPRRLFNNPEMEDYNLHFLDFNGKFISSEITNETPNRIDISSSHMVNCLDNGDVLFQPVLGNTIYRINNNTVSAYYAFKNLSKYKLMTKKDKEKFISSTAPNGECHFKEKEAQGYLLTWGEVIDLTDYTFFGFLGLEKRRYLYYSKKTSKTILIEPENVKGNKNLINILMSYPFTAKGNRLYVSPHPNLIWAARGNINNEKLNTFFNNVDIDANPVIISFSINIPEKNI